jgi:2-polyprenyl-3-methyl-5-hydroxy-6-metoxy-1,4-benzoquinol methylase
MQKQFWNTVSGSFLKWIGYKPPNLLDDVVRKFDVSEKFVLEYQRLRPDLDWSRGNWNKFLDSLSPLDRLHISFAMSTVLRGRYAYSLLDGHSCIQAKRRYLDIGTAYAGFLRAFKEQGFEEVIGIELQERLADLGKANIDGLKDARVIVGDFIENDYSSLGTFDVVTCNDVIEHVDDAVVAIKKMSSMVADGGCVSMEVPNRDCINFVTSDGHFQIFGITQLDRDDAALHYEAVLKADRKNYFFQMGEMHGLDWYVEQLSKNSLNAFIADTHRIGGIKDVPALLADLKQAYENWRANVKPRLEPLLVEKLTNAVDAYIQRLEHDVSRINDENSEKRFEDKYLRSFWTIFAIKGKPRVESGVEHSHGGDVSYIQKLEADVREKDDQIAYLNEQIIQMRKSFSWKFSRPFRFLMRFVHSPRRSFYELLDFLRLKMGRNG